ncbi:DUF3037 domain-containing protein [Massilia haematophila]|uniref:DUF3037 domain-containing protein n=1 Tax=Massilia haematophila TaxID=457923 RepID=A0ABV7PG99_9BURK
MDSSVMRHACRYAIVRFMPFPETEEFVNIGIILACPAQGYFGFRLQQRKRHGRVTNFFPDIGKESYKEAIEMFSRELSRVQYIAHSDLKGSPVEIRKLFDALVHPREALIRFSSPRARMADDPVKVLDKLFGYYVERNFVTVEYKETILERRIRNLVQSLNLPKPFRAAELGDEFASAQFPLVQEDRHVPIKAIKPFYLAQPEPSKIIAHGGLWVDRISRMRRRRTLPKALMFAIESPPPEESKRYSAFEEIKQDLEALDVITIPAQAENEIIDFATDDHHLFHRF